MKILIDMLIPMKNMGREFLIWLDRVMVYCFSNIDAKIKTCYHLNFFIIMELVRVSFGLTDIIDSLSILSTNRVHCISGEGIWAFTKVNHNLAYGLFTQGSYFRIKIEWFLDENTYYMVLIQNHGSWIYEKGVRVRFRWMKEWYVIPIYLHMGIVCKKLILKIHLT